MIKFFNKVFTTHTLQSNNSNNPAPFNNCTKYQLIKYYYLFNCNNGDIKWSEIVKWYEMQGWIIKQIAIDIF